jgi:hypothetical protein
MENLVVRRPGVSLCARWNEFIVVGRWLEGAAAVLVVFESVKSSLVSHALLGALDEEETGGPALWNRLSPSLG